MIEDIRIARMITSEHAPGFYVGASLDGESMQDRVFATMDEALTEARAYIEARRTFRVEFVTVTEIVPENKDINTSMLDTVSSAANCPGFNLWDVLASDGKRYLMAGDHKSGVETRLFFRTQPSELTAVNITLIGPNPDVQLWDAYRVLIGYEAWK